MFLSFGAGWVNISKYYLKGSENLVSVDTLLSVRVCKKASILGTSCGATLCAGMFAGEPGGPPLSIAVSEVTFPL